MEGDLDSEFQKKWFIDYDNKESCYSYTQEKLPREKEKIFDGANHKNDEEKRTNDHFPSFSQ